MRIFSVFDSKAEVWMQPRYELNAGVALREFADIAQGINDPQGRPNPIAMHPEDYTLFELGRWDQDNGHITMHDAKHSLGVAIEFINRERPQLAAVGDSKIQGGE